jgi:hypothetical protein
MSKLGQAELVEAVQGELVTYLQNGTIDERAIVQALDISGLDIADLDRLKRIHFCLSDAVVEFVDGIQADLRRIKTATQREREQTRGEIRGSIDWQATTRLRYTEAPGDRTRFACKTANTEYDIPENLVLKKLLWTIYTTAESELSNIDYEWRRRAWPDDAISTFERLYKRNVHLNRITNGNAIAVDDRMLNVARTARQSLYTRTYTLYDCYRRLLAGQYGAADVQEILHDTLVVPERIPRLFELFCLFRLLRVFEGGELELQPIESAGGKLATLESEDRRIDVYHDETGDLSFHVPLSELDGAIGDYPKRYRRTQERHETLVDTFLGNSVRQSLFHGRPDLVVEVYDTTDGEVLTDVLLGEIKYSDRAQTFTSGLEQLVKYLEFAQRDGYLSDQSVTMHGFLITDGVETDVAVGGNIRHVTAKELLDGGSIPDQLVPVS